MQQNFRISFDGGDLSSDGGLLLLKEFFHKLGLKELLSVRGCVSGNAGQYPALEAAA